MYCYRCGKQIEDGALFCGYCGARQPQDVPEDEGDSWTAGVEYYSGQGYPYEQEERRRRRYPPTEPQEEEESRGLGKFPAVLIVLFVVLFLVAAALVYLLAGKSGSKKTGNSGSDLFSGLDETESETLLVGDAGAEQTEKPASTESGAETESRITEQTETDQPETETEQQAAQSTYTVIIGDYSWEEAEEYCREQGGHLATITSAEEEQQIIQAIGQAGYDLHVIWLGATNLQSADGSFAWTTGEAFAYQNWAPGEPSGTDGMEHYLEMYKSGDTWKWNDVPNEIAMYYSGDMGFVMEKE